MRTAVPPSLKIIGLSRGISRIFAFYRWAADMQVGYLVRVEVAVVAVPVAHLAAVARSDCQAGLDLADQW